MIRKFFELQSNYILMGTDYYEKYLVTVTVLSKASMNVSNIDLYIQMSIN